MITLERAVELVWHAFADMEGGEIYVKKKIPSMKLTDIARAIAPEAQTEVVGIRPGEKLHEQMISEEDAHYTYEYDEYYKILPAIHSWSEDAANHQGRPQDSPKVCPAVGRQQGLDGRRVAAWWIDANGGKLGTI